MIWNHDINAPRFYPVQICGHQAEASSLAEAQRLEASSCGDCWQLAFDQMAAERENAERDRKASHEAMLEGIAISKACNRHGCPYCGGIA